MKNSRAKSGTLPSGGPRIVNEHNNRMQIWAQTRCKLRRHFQAFSNGKPQTFFLCFSASVFIVANLLSISRWLFRCAHPNIRMSTSAMPAMYGMEDCVKWYVCIVSTFVVRHHKNSSFCVGALSERQRPLWNPEFIIAAVRNGNAAMS